MILKSLSQFLLFLMLYSFMVTGGCKKEYSYEGGPVPDSISVVDSGLVNDSANTATPSFYQCGGCNSLNPSADLYWNFKVGSVTLCGGITNTVVSPDDNAFTFFGPSACSVDSGLIITASFDNHKLTGDLANLVAARSSLEYYDNIDQSDVLHSKQPNIFSLTIDKYDTQTGIATGTFKGVVLAKNGALVKVESGSFRIKF